MKALFENAFITSKQFPNVNPHRLALVHEQLNAHNVLGRQRTTTRTINSTTLHRIETFREFAAEIPSQFSARLMASNLSLHSLAANPAQLMFVLV